jgi:hypothetical protein
MSKDEYDSLLETTYLLRSPKNARRLIDAIESARAGDVAKHDLTGDLTASSRGPQAAGRITSTGRARIGGPSSGSIF